jgi:hypothetical protein
LEDSGYLARAATLIDRPFQKIGLSGRSFVPLLSNVDIPGHYIKEVASTELRSGISFSRLFCAIFENGRPAGYLSANYCNPTDEMLRKI